MIINTGIVLAVCGGAVGQLFMKAGMQNLSLSSPAAFITGIQAYPSATLFVSAGICAYVLSMFCWVHSLKNMKLSTAYPILSLSYVLVYLGAVMWPVINESYSTQKTIGIALILFGVWFSTSNGSNEER